VPVLVALVVVACFAPVLGHDFVTWDDDLNLTENPHYRGLSCSHLGWMFTTRLGGHYQPLTWVTLGLDYLLWGMDARGYHLTSLALHVINAFCVYALARTLLPPVPSGLASAAAAGAGALAFAIHPLRVESVAWVSERRDVLSGLFYVLTLLAYVRAASGGSTAARLGWLAASLGCFGLSLLSKAWGITLPLVLVVLDVHPLRRVGRHRAALLLEKVPYVILAAWAAWQAYRSVEPIAATRTLAEHGVAARAAQAVYGLCFYVQKTFLPVGLSPLYLLEPALDPSGLRYVLSAVLVVAATVALVLMRRRWPWALAAWACYVVTVSPVLGLVQTGPQIAADRYTYLACLPFAVLFGAGVLHTWPVRTPRVAALAVLAVLGTLTYRQTWVWKDWRSLWEHTLRVDAENFVAYTNRGSGRSREGDVEGALADYSTAIRLNPYFALAYYNRGSLRQEQGDLAGAVADLSRAIGLDPTDPKAWNNRGWALEAGGDLRGAIADYAQALSVAPPDWEGRARVEENLAFARARLKAWGR
jgi:tetratricopeptide (TPR) repeat protein